MTPKEKADEIYNGFDMIIYTDQDHYSQVKSCSLLAVDGILLAIDWHEYEYPNEQFEYWHEVRTEI